MALGDGVSLLSVVLVVAVVGGGGGCGGGGGGASLVRNQDFQFFRSCDSYDVGSVEVGG